MPLRVGTPLPSFDGATEWLNGAVRSEDMIGKPVLVQFWAVSCPVCKMNMPSVHAWKEQYRTDGAQIISIHMPRSQADTDTEKVRCVAEELGITEPCAIDNEHLIGKRFQTSGMWPYYFLFDSAGRMRCHAAGRTGLRLTENALKRLLSTQESREGVQA